MLISIFYSGSKTNAEYKKLIRIQLVKIIERRN